MRSRRNTFATPARAFLRGCGVLALIGCAFVSWAIGYGLAGVVGVVAPVLSLVAFFVSICLAMAALAIALDVH